VYWYELKWNKIIYLGRNEILTVGMGSVRLLTTADEGSDAKPRAKTSSQQKRWRMREPSFPVLELAACKIYIPAKAKTHSTCKYSFYKI
jgi:hypothetical protein